MGRFSLERLRTLVTITDHGSISAAARTLGLAQSSVSSSLQHLENEIGAVLIDRSGRSLRLTEAGWTMLHYARSIISLAEEATDQVARLKLAPITGTLSIGGTGTAAHTVLPAALGAFLGSYQGIELLMTIQSSLRTVQQVVSGELPLAMIAGPAEHPSLEVLHVANEENVVIVSRSHPLANQDAETKSLRGVRVLLREEGSTTRSYQLALMERWNIPGVQTSTIASTSAILSAVAHGLGLTCLPRAVAEHALQVGAVAEIRFNEPLPVRPVSLIRRADRPPTLIEELFFERIKEKATACPPSP
ncbi:hypothetical protein ASF72_16555 [Arthrobacter sp. Leaf141]|uniref:LysR family transcriptional regulator n=1 Tax=Arthrobacter sp. Leaf141 TaxID=1736273 RepID=UPI0006F91091|nr:LysR family transcriptional regulator [Arthrobacter sp. Leaf141]KQR00454.1 hypothetical protein ASF72_16555 [Arthrobacter sp. Leaf141]